jgi:hypothetical protein
VHRPVHFAVVFDHSLREPRPADLTAKEGLGVKASDEQRVDKLQGVTRPARSQTAAGRLWRRRRPDASIQNDSGPPQGPATGSVVG